MKQILICLSALGTLLLAQTAFAQDVKKTRTISGISRLRASMGIETIVRLGDTESLHIEAKNIPEDKILIEQDGDELILKLGLEASLDKKVRRSVKAYLTVRQLRGVSVSAGATVKGESTFEADRFDLSSKAGATVALTLNVRDLTVNSNSGATVNVSGTARSVSISAGSGASVNAGDLVADVVDADAGSGASVRVNAQKELFGKASVGGSVSNKGPGRTVSKRTSLGGSVN
ncbi:GIN domain-containing protein [Fibrella sp. WM1]|uniref:GIN domain-containing protein n=1 Tax=Fibrella musci TaxID=3242485 RepID=UPI00351FE3BB